ncbi:MAG TPA: YihY/virulence factor BrkB family protein [Candidatus Didemnitutus sp.]|nr:YihY/virulence factor BrkB family protein [Candidatus Didemnitutus sp.]
MKQSEPRILTQVKHAWDLFYDFVDITDRRHIFLLSSGIAFNLLLCTIPLLILILSVVSGVIDEDLTKSSVQNFLVNFLPQNTQATDLIGVIVKELGSVFNARTVAGWIAGITLLWLASTLFSSLRTGLNAIFHIPTPKFFVIYRLKDMLLTIITTILILVVTLMSPLLTFAETYWTGILPELRESLLFGLTVRVASLVATTIVFFLLYRLVPNKKLPWPVVLISTGAAVVLWEFARVLFSWYVNSASDFGKFYGGYVALASFALWLYYSAFVFLLAAELGQYIHTLRTQKVKPTP